MVGNLLACSNHLNSLLHVYFPKKQIGVELNWPQWPAKLISRQKLAACLANSIECWPTTEQQTLPLKSLSQGKDSDESHLDHNRLKKQSPQITGIAADTTLKQFFERDPPDTPGLGWRVPSRFQPSFWPTLSFQSVESDALPLQTNCVFLLKIVFSNMLIDFIDVIALRLNFLLVMNSHSLVRKSLTCL